MTHNQNTNNLYDSIRELIEIAKSNIVRNVNTTMILTYYEIGRIIVEDEQKGKYRADYAKQVLLQLSKRLTKEFGKGYSLTNLEYIRKFYKVYYNRIPQSVVGKFEKSKRDTKS